MKASDVTLSARATDPSGLSWLAEVRDAVQPLSESAPVWVRHGVVHSGPAVPHPERHPYCEFGTVLGGWGTQFVGRQQARRSAGHVFLAGPGVPHWFEIGRYPFHFATIYFLPGVLVEAAPHGDGLRLLRRFTGRHAIERRLVQPPPALSRKLTRGFRDVATEFDGRQVGREVRLRTLLLEMLVALVRHEQDRGLDVADPGGGDVDWKLMERALRYLQARFQEPVYADALAGELDVSESRLKSLFRDALGMPWGRYLQSYRIHRAAALLAGAGLSVTDVAFSVGFESLSHFNATFHSFMGVSPRAYADRSGKSAAAR